MTTTVYALNPKYKDGTRLRASPAHDSTFNGVWVPNDMRLEIIATEGEFRQVRKPDGQDGWIRDRNLTTTARVTGVTKDVITTEIVTPDPEYVRGIKIYNLGIKEDPVPGQKFGKGLQHLISSHWLSAMSEFIGAHFTEARELARHAHEGSKQHRGYDQIYFANTANQLFSRAEALGLHGQDAMDLFLMATWLVMAAAEVDDFPFRKYSTDERAKQRDQLYEMYLSPRAGPGVVSGIARDDAAILGKFATPISRRDLLPPIAMERLGINNELSALKYSDAAAPLRDGFLISTRIDSLKRHFEAMHRGLTDEDHAIHLLWNFHAIYHVAVVFPEKNDLVTYAQRKSGAEKPKAYEPTTSLEKIKERSLEPHAVQKLDWNEGAIAPPPSVMTALVAYIRAADGAYLKWYPQLGGGPDLRAKLAAYCDGIPENILVTNGSDDALILLCHAYLRPDDIVMAPVPTYEHFCVNAAATGASLVRLDLPDPFVADADAIIGGIERHKPALVYLVSPNNPTGIEWKPNAVKGLAKRFPDVTFIVDEAYYEFASVDVESKNTKKLISCAKLATEEKNIIVTRTFSKAFCLASLRIGYLIAHPTTVENLRAYYNPKSVNQLAQIAAVNALREFEGYYRPYIDKTNDERRSFMNHLEAAGIDVRSGGAGNFVCVRIPDGPSRAALVCRRLEDQAIYVRDIGGRFPGYIRITIGLDMSRVTTALIDAMK